MKNQGGNNYLILNQIKKISIRYPNTFDRFNKTYTDIINDVLLFQ